MMPAAAQGPALAQSCLAQSQMARWAVLAAWPCWTRCSTAPCGRSTAAGQGQDGGRRTTCIYSRCCRTGGLRQVQVQPRLQHAAQQQPGLSGQAPARATQQEQPRRQRSLAAVHAAAPACRLSTCGAACGPVLPWPGRLQQQGMPEFSRACAAGGSASRSCCKHACGDLPSCVRHQARHLHQGSLPQAAARQR
jgi:hypothetical protein